MRAKLRRIYRELKHFQKYCTTANDALQSLSESTSDCSSELSLDDDRGKQKTINLCDLIGTENFQIKSQFFTPALITIRV